MNRHPPLDGADYHNVSEAPNYSLGIFRNRIGIGSKFAYSDVGGALKVPLAKRRFSTRKTQ